MNCPLNLLLFFIPIFLPIHLTSNAYRLWIVCLFSPQPPCRFRWSRWVDGSRPSWGGGTGMCPPLSRSWRRRRSCLRSRRTRSFSWRSTPCSDRSTPKTGRYLKVLWLRNTRRHAKEESTYFKIQHMKATAWRLLWLKSEPFEVCASLKMCTKGKNDAPYICLSHFFCLISFLSESRSLRCPRTRPPEVQSHTETDQSCPWVISPPALTAPFSGLRFPPAACWFFNTQW